MDSAHGGTEACFEKARVYRDELCLKLAMTPTD